jgi:hypothetical protein
MRHLAAVAPSLLRQVAENKTSLAQGRQRLELKGCGLLIEAA